MTRSFDPRPCAKSRVRSFTFVGQTGRSVDIEVADRVVDGMEPEERARILAAMDGRVISHIPSDEMEDLQP